MSGTLSQFRIEGLHGRRTLDVRITDNVLVLVGENGTGKSTVANFIYYFLTRQWHRLLDYQFASITAVLDDRPLVVRREDLTEDSVAIREQMPLRPSSYGRFTREVHSLLRSTTPAEILENPSYILRLADRMGMPSHYVKEVLIALSMGELHVPNSGPLRNASERIEQSLSGKVLYLPTFRRIEQDLKRIYPGLQKEIDQARERAPRRELNDSYIELVEFGMGDVEKTIADKMQLLKDKLLITDLNRLIGTYLRDVIHGDYTSGDMLPKLTKIDDATVEAILARVPRTILQEEEKRMLLAMVRRVKTEHAIPDDVRVVAHFLSQLIDLQQAQQESEKDVVEFARACNHYLHPSKEIRYNTREFKVVVTHAPEGDAPEQELALRMLSSGEKQIVSLFSQIFLSDIEEYFVIIDEPELSLSVTWQKRFLHDIIGSGRCKGLVAVTHSPFIYDNELDQYAHSLDEFVEPYHVAS